MTKQTEYVQRIEKQYVGEECLQIMIPYKDSMTIIGETGVQFHYKNGSSHYVNAYLQDERRKQFPYSNIPTHYSRANLFGKVSYTNQLLNFEQPYIKIGNGAIVESFAVKDQDEALLINKVVTYNQTTTYKNREELMNLFGNKNSGQTYFIYPSGGMNLESQEKIVPSEEQIEHDIVELLRINVEEFENYRDRETASIVSDYLVRHPQFLQFVSQSIDQIDFSKYKFNYRIISNEPILIVNVNNSEISIKGVKVYFIGPDKYRVEEYNIPVNKFTLEQLKYVSHIYRSKEPSVPRSLNPGVSRQDIIEAKNMVKSLKKR